MDDTEIKKQALQKLLDNQQDEVSKRLFETTHKFPDTGRTAHSPGEVIDGYIGAPIRAGLAKASDVQVGENGQEGTGFLSMKPMVEGAKAVYEQFGKDPKNAPTGKMVAEKAGASSLPFSETPGLSWMYRDPKKEQLEAFDIRPEKGGMLDVSPAGIAGFGTEMATDPLTYTSPKGLTKALSGIEVLNPALHREASARAFAKAVEEARGLRPDVVENVSQYTPQEYSKMRTFLSRDGKSGYALKPTDKGDELVNVFAKEKGLGRGDKIVSEAVDRGAQTLDAFDGYLPDLYKKHGFKEYHRTPNYEPGGPDVVYMTQPNNPHIPNEKIMSQSANLPPELQPQYQYVNPPPATPEQIAQIDKMAKKMQYERVKNMMDRRAKTRSMNLDADTAVIQPKKTKK
jgi:hypothetical protein